MLDITDHIFSADCTRGCLAKTIRTDNNIFTRDCRNLQKVIFTNLTKDIDFYYIDKDITIEFEPNNPYIIVQDNIIFSSDKTNLFGVLSNFNQETFTIPKTVTKIYPYAFRHAKTTKTIIINQKINFAFIEANYVTKIILNLDEKTLEVPSNVFMKCQSLERIEINGPIVTIGYQNWPALTSFKFEKNSTFESTFEYTLLESLDLTDYNIKGRFAGCSKLKHVKLGSNTHIFESMFFNCVSLKEIDLSKVKEIERDAFFNCISLESIDLSSLTNKISFWAFYNCTNLKNIIWPKKRFYVNPYAFSHLSSINIVIPENIIAFNGFYSCNFSSVTLPSSVFNIDPKAFINCNIDKLILPATVHAINFTNLTVNAIEISGNNQYLMVDGNALVNKITGELVALFGTLGHSYTLPSSVHCLGSFSFLAKSQYTNREAFILKVSSSVVEMKHSDPYSYTMCYEYDIPPEGDASHFSSQSQRVFVNEDFDQDFAEFMNEFSTDFNFDGYGCNETIPDSNNQQITQPPINESGLSRGEIALIVITILLCITLVAVVSFYVYLFYKKPQET